jgi:uncharacterized membrane protein YeiB
LLHDEAFDGHEKVMARYLKPNLLILDDMGMKQLAKRSALSRALPGPVAPASRIVEIDMVRGFALFGVLLVNMYNFGADSIAWDSKGDQLTFALMRVFFQSKSWTLFSILFGFGFAVQLQRADARGFRLLPVHLRRLSVLFALGAAHRCSSTATS